MAEEENEVPTLEEDTKFEYSTRKKVIGESSELASLKHLSMSLKEDEPSDIAVDKPDKTSKYIISVRPQRNCRSSEKVPAPAYKCQVCSRTSMRIYVLTYHLKSHFKQGFAEIKPTKRKNKLKAGPTKKSIKISNALFAKHLALPTTTSAAKSTRKQVGPVKQKMDGKTILKGKNRAKQTKNLDEQKASKETEATQTSPIETDVKPKVTKRGSKEIQSKSASPEGTEVKPKVAKRSDTGTPVKKTSPKNTETVAKRSYKKKQRLSETETPRADVKKTPRKNSENIKTKESLVSDDTAKDLNNPSNNSAKKRGRPAGKISTPEKVPAASSEKSAKMKKAKAVKRTAFEPDEIHNIILLDFEKSDENKANVSIEVEEGHNESISAYDASEWDEAVSGDEETGQRCSVDQSKTISEESGLDMELESSSIENNQSLSKPESKKSVSNGEMVETSVERGNPEKSNNEIIDLENAEDSAINESDFSNIADIQLDSDDDEEMNSKEEIEFNKMEATENVRQIEISKSKCVLDDSSDVANAEFSEKRKDLNGENLNHAELQTNVIANGTQYDENDKIIRDIADMDIEDEFGIPQMGNILDSLANGFSTDENNLSPNMITSDKNSNGEPVEGHIELKDQTELICQKKSMKLVGKANDDLILDIKILNQVSLLKSRPKQHDTNEKVSDNEDVITIEDSD